MNQTRKYALLYGLSESSSVPGGRYYRSAEANCGSQRLRHPCRQDGSPLRCCSGCALWHSPPPSVKKKTERSSDMIEIVFGEGACGSLKVAQGYGKGKYPGGAVSVFIRNTDGTAPAAEEIQAAQLRAEEEARRDWENAVPLDSRRDDVHCFDIALSVGDISDDGIGNQRRNVLRQMLSVHDREDIGDHVEEKIQRTTAALSSVMERYVLGEDVRIWYSHNPDELCGMYWLMAQLRPLKSQTAIYLVNLPIWEYGKENTVIFRNGWGDVAPGEWGKYISLQEKVRPAFLSACAMKWRQLQEENAPLRVMLNGKLQSVPEDIYDCFIDREIAAQPDEFKMAVVIGNVLGKYQLGIGDVWVSNRIEKMIDDGILEIVQDAPKGELRYRRILRKRRGFGLCRLRT